MTVSAIYVAVEAKINNLTTEPSSIIECSFNKTFADLFTKCGEFEEEPVVTKVRAFILFLFSCK